MVKYSVVLYLCSIRYGRCGDVSSLMFIKQTKSTSVIKVCLSGVTVHNKYQIIGLPAQHIASSRILLIYIEVEAASHL